MANVLLSQGDIRGLSVDKLLAFECGSEGVAHSSITPCTVPSDESFLLHYHLVLEYCSAL